MRGIALLMISLMVAGCLSGPDAPETTSDGPTLFPPTDLRVPAGVATDPAGNSTLAFAASLAAGPQWPFPVFDQAVEIAPSTGREMSLALDPRDPTTMIACSPTGTGVVGVGKSDVWTSSDDGATWTARDIENSPDTRTATDEGGDCDVAIGPSGEMYVVDSWLGSLSMGRSDDGGQTWTGIAVAAYVPMADRPWILVDAAGTLHMTYHDLQCCTPSLMWYTQSSDGMTFSPPVPITHAGPDGLGIWEGNFVISDDGMVLDSIYTRRPIPLGAGPEQVWIAHSDDGGASWTNTMHSQRDGSASFLYPAIARDAAGGLHAVWSEDRGADQPTMYSHKPAGGAWTEAVPILEGLVTGAPWVAAGDAGRAAIMFSGTPDSDLPEDEQRQFLYWAQADNGSLQAATTTAEPFFIGPQGTYPEFDMVRVGSDGVARIAAVVPSEDDDRVVWRPVYQRQAAGPLVGPAP